MRKRKKTPSSLLMGFGPGPQLYLTGQRKEGNVLFNDTLNTFYLRLYGIRHMVNDDSDSERKPAAAT